MSSPKRAYKAKSEWSERVVAIQRVTKVVKGGKKMSFRAVIVVGNEQGKVGVGVGKAGDVITAVRKGVTDGKKNIISIPLYFYKGLTFTSIQYIIFTVIAISGYYTWKKILDNSNQTA